MPFDIKKIALFSVGLFVSFFVVAYAVGAFNLGSILGAVPSFPLTLPTAITFLVVGLVFSYVAPMLGG